MPLRYKYINRLKSAIFLCAFAVPCGLVARIPGFHPGGPGSIPGMGRNFEEVEMTKFSCPQTGMRPIFLLLLNLLQFLN